LPRDGTFGGACIVVNLTAEASALVAPAGVPSPRATMLNHPDSAPE
jgi:hypothetical protein